MATSQFFRMVNYGYLPSLWLQRYCKTNRQTQREGQRTSNVRAGNRASAIRGGQRTWNIEDSTARKDSGREGIKAAWLACVLFGSIIAVARADEPSLWLTSGMWSRHPNEDHYHFNQKNTGWGLAYEDHDRNHTYVIGDYYNSIRQDSKYIGMIHDPWSIGPVRFGYMAGLVSGYSQSPKYLPVAAPMASYEYHGIGVNFVWVPSVVVAVQLKIRIW